MFLPLTTKSSPFPGIPRIPAAFCTKQGNCQEQRQQFPSELMKQFSSYPPLPCAQCVHCLALALRQALSGDGCGSNTCTPALLPTQHCPSFRIENILITLSRVQVQFVTLWRRTPERRRVFGFHQVQWDTNTSPSVDAQILNFPPNNPLPQCQFLQTLFFCKWQIEQQFPACTWQVFVHPLPAEACTCLRSIRVRTDCDKSEDFH